MVIKFFNCKVLFYKEFVCINLVCINLYCFDVMCGVKGLDVVDKYKYYVFEFMFVNNQVFNSMVIRFFNCKVFFYKEFVCINLVCVDLYCFDVMCGIKVMEIKSYNFDFDLYFFRYVMDIVVVYSKDML